MPKSKNPRTTKSKSTINVLQMPEVGNGNGQTQPHSPADLEAEIRLRAYELYQQRGATPGDDTTDWFAAEREIRARHAGQKHSA